MGYRKKLIPCICTNCGAALNVEPDQKTAKCPYCDTTFIIESEFPSNEINNDQNSKEPDQIQRRKKGTEQNVFDNTDTRSVEKEQAESHSREGVKVQAKNQSLSDEKDTEQPQIRRQEEQEGIRVEESHPKELGAEARERARVKEEAGADKELGFWSDLLDFILALLLAPAILVTVLVNRNIERKEKPKRIANGSKGSKHPLLLVLLVILGEFAFIFIIVFIFRGFYEYMTSSDSQNTAQSIEETVVVPTEAVTITPTITPESTRTPNWYEQPKRTFGPGEFLEDTVTNTLGIFNYEIPESWEEENLDENSYIYYCPTKRNMRAFVFMAYIDYDHLPDSAFELMTDECLYDLLSEPIVAGIDAETYSDIHIKPYLINGYRAGVLFADVLYDPSGTPWESIQVCYPVHDQVLFVHFGTGRKDSDVNKETLYAILQSIIVADDDLVRAD